MYKISKYFRGVGEEARRIRWPDQKTLWRSVGIVLLIAVGFALYIYLCNLLSLQIMKGFRTAFGVESSDSSSTDSETTSEIVNLIIGGFLR